MKGVFKCAMEDDERRSRSVKRSSLGMPPCISNKYSRRLKRLSPPWHPHGPPMAPLWPLPGSSRSFLYADFSCIFLGIFLALFIWEKTEIEKQQKTGTGTGVH